MTSSKGYASLLSFPFRIYGDAFLPQLEGTTVDLGLRIRLYPPFRVREKGSPLSPDIPFASWPGFSWHPKVPREEQLAPPKHLHSAPFGARAYDAMRIDSWGFQAEAGATSFALGFLGWLRFLTRQPWIGRFESHTDPLVKNTFAIDDQGRALVTPYAQGVVQTPNHTMRPVSESDWREAFAKALASEEPPTHWGLFLDSENNLSLGLLHEGILSLSLCLEVARDTLLSRFAPNPQASDKGVERGPPFAGTDLCKHLSAHLEIACNRNLQKEHPALYKVVDDLYVARHHVAHGKRAIVRLKGKTRPATLADLEGWLTPIRDTVSWLEAL